MVIEVICKDGRVIVSENLVDERIEAGMLGAIVEEMIFTENEFYRP